MALERKFEKFTGGRYSRDPGEVRVTINRHGTIYMNAKAYQALSGPKAVALFYNREDDQIALEPAYERFIENFPVLKKQMGFAIHAANFCRHYNIRVPNTERFLRPDLTNEGQLILNLKQTITVGGIEKGKRKADAQ